MLRVLKTLRAVQWLFLASVLLYAFLGEKIVIGTRAVKPTLNYLFATMAVALIGVIFVVRRTLVLHAEGSLVTRPDDRVSLNHWRSGYFATYALCEMLALFGLALRLLGGNLQQSLPFYIGGFALLLFFRPRAPVTPSSS